MNFCFTALLQVCKSEDASQIIYSVKSKSMLVLPVAGMNRICRINCYRQIVKGNFKALRSHFSQLALILTYIWLKGFSTLQFKYPVEV